MIVFPTGKRRVDPAKPEIERSSLKTKSVHRLGTILFLIAALLIAAAWGVSFWYAAFWATPVSGAGINRGAIFVARGETFRESGFYFERSDLELQWLPKWRFGYTGEWLVLIPLWIPLLVVFLIFLLYRRRSGMVGVSACKRCGYNLTGNVSGVCPECGTAVEGGATFP